MVITCESPKGRRILDFLTKELNLPENIIGFTFKMRVGELPIVNVDYRPEEDKEDND